MQFSKYGALAGLLGAVQASPAIQPDSVMVRTNDIVAPRTSGSSCSSDLTKSWQDETFYSGYVLVLPYPSSYQRLTMPL